MALSKTIKSKAGAKDEQNELVSARWTPLTHPMPLNPHATYNHITYSCGQNYSGIPF